MLITYRELGDRDEGPDLCTAKRFVDLRITVSKGQERTFSRRTLHKNNDQFSMRQKVRLRQAHSSLQLVKHR